MRRREFITLLGGTVAAWPVAARAQQRERLRRIGVLTGGPNDLSFRSDLTAFQKALQQLGWIEGRNVEFNVRSGDNNAQRVTTEAKELVRVKPDVILVGPSNALLPLRKETNTIPIVFVRVSEAKGSSRVWPDHPATSRVSAIWSFRWSANGCKRLKKSRPALSASR